MHILGILLVLRLKKPNVKNKLEKLEKNFISPKMRG